jgi:crotonobetainyl-CoA:carnitine CoA-transferase CaiB-like acyl-CoA transferase
MSRAEAQPKSPVLPLSGIRVLDFTHAASGPLTTMLMADMGADVIKIERPQYGDGSRSMGVSVPGFPRGNSDYYLSLNRNKKSVALDLAQAQGAEVVRRLVQLSDVVIQNFRPGVMDRLGLGFSDLCPLRKSLIYCSISAFGDAGPWSRRPANDIIVQSVSGLMGVTGEIGGGPLRVGAPVSDYSAGLFALAGVLAALHARQSHPTGQHVKVSMLESSLNLMCNYIPSVAGLGATIPRLGRAHAQIVPYQAFGCADGEYVMVGAFTREFWLNLCRALGHEEWAMDPRFATNTARLKHRDLLVTQLEEIFAAHPRAHWLAVLDEADVPSSPVFELHEAVRSEQVEFDGSIQQMAEGDRHTYVARSAVRSEQWVTAPLRLAPGLGADSVMVLESVLGMSPAAVRDLIREGVVATEDLQPKIPVGQPSHVRRGQRHNA